mmetsp:Transcript_57016/g.161908  ORF Transcript_57016/g.161908 Transcript_57016/m.161908 type:complete len:115 (-) Transcript_57016:126-470(-)
MQKEDEEFSFPKLNEEVTLALPQVIERVLGKVAEYHAKQVEEWSESIGVAVLEKLQELSGNFKYIVNISIIEKKGAGFHTSSAVFWNGETDGGVSYRWENKALLCVVQAFGIGV